MVMVVIIVLFFDLLDIMMDLTAAVMLVMITCTESTQGPYHVQAASQALYHNCQLPKYKISFTDTG